MKIICIIQARINSTRLHRKVLKNIMKKPMLWYLINRIKYSKIINDIVIATTKKDNEIQEFANKYSLKIYQGSENDIVDRFYCASKIYNADIIVRVWGDNPLIDSNIIDKSLKNFIQDNYEYANNFNPSTYPLGLNFEIYTFKSLERIWKNTNNDYFYRKYPCEYVYAHEDMFKTLYDKNDVDLSYINLSVDYMKDFELIKEIIMKFYNKENDININDVVSLLEFSNFKDINKELKRNIEYKNAVRLRKGE